MTTPNNQPAPPPGMEILADYTKPLPSGAMIQMSDGWAPSDVILGSRPHPAFIYAIPITVPATGDTTNEKGGEQRQEWRPKDRLIAVPDPRDVSAWYILTEADQLHVASVRCIVAEGFAKGLVETWNASLDVQPVEQRQELLPCPFCEQEKAEVQEREYPFIPSIGDEQFRVICNFLYGGCGSSTGYRKTKEEARQLWNTRK